jgi:homoserine dehydrogenase
MAEALRVGIAGLGTVGASVVRVLHSKAAELTRQCGRDIAVTAVCARDRSRDRGVDLGNAQWFEDPTELAKKTDIDVFVELMGGEEGSARASVKRWRQAGMSSPPTRRCWPSTAWRLAEIAEKKGVLLNYEAAVAGGIPVIKTMREAMAGNSVNRVFGILNGTCNYILTRMEARD